MPTYRMNVLAHLNTLLLVDAPDLATATAKVDSWNAADLLTALGIDAGIDADDVAGWEALDGVEVDTSAPPAIGFLREAGLELRDVDYHGDRYSAGHLFPDGTAVLALVDTDEDTTTILTASPDGDYVTIAATIGGAGTVAMASVYAVAEAAMRLLGGAQ